MIRRIMYLVFIALAGGGIYYVMNYDKDNPENNDIINSTKEFGEDVVEGGKKVVEKTKEVIDSSEVFKESQTEDDID
jgi:hypothetical protein